MTFKYPITERSLAVHQAFRRSFRTTNTVRREPAEIGPRFQYRETPSACWSLADLRERRNWSWKIKRLLLYNTFRGILSLGRSIMAGVIRSLKQLRGKAIRRMSHAIGLNVDKTANYYSTLPVNDDLRKTQDRWLRPSALTGIYFDIEEMKRSFLGLHQRWQTEYAAETGDYASNTKAGFGPGYPEFDARVLYYVLRQWKPQRYLEVGSGLSTYYASFAAAKNKLDGASMNITCIEPHPFPALYSVPDIRIVSSVAQDVPIERFRQLQDGDVLFIDSSHALKIDSDVAYLFLEVLPCIAKGVNVHIHDVPFPYNVPFPPRRWIFGSDWPVYWNEAMVVQTFLAFNPSFEITLSTPIIRHFDEAFLRGEVQSLKPIAEDNNPYSSLWLRRVA